MHDPALGTFDHVVAMDSLIHYNEADVAHVLAGIAERTRHSVVFTFAPWTLPLAMMHRVGKLFPKSDRSPAIVPLREERLRRRAEAGQFTGLAAMREKRVSRGFYISQAMELSRS
jgi:magnesium-protoporphyrin O-methyltransferase